MKIAKIQSHITLGGQEYLISGYNGTTERYMDAVKNYQEALLKRPIDRSVIFLAQRELGKVTDEIISQANACLYLTDKYPTANVRFYSDGKKGMEQKFVKDEHVHFDGFNRLSSEDYDNLVLVQGKVTKPSKKRSNSSIEVIVEMGPETRFSELFNEHGSPAGVLLRYANKHTGRRVGKRSMDAILHTNK